MEGGAIIGGERGSRCNGADAQGEDFCSAPGERRRSNPSFGAVCVGRPASLTPRPHRSRIGWPRDTHPPTPVLPTPVCTFFSLPHNSDRSACFQGAFHDRDRLRAALDEALGRCASSLVAKQLAEEERNALQQQLIAERLHEPRGQ